MSAERTPGLVSRRRAVSLGAGLAAVAVFGAESLVARSSPARVRARPGGTLRLRVPWSLATIDPHRLDDPGAMVFGECLFDGLYRVDAAGAVVPALAESMPEPLAQGHGAGARVTLREGVRFASGRPLTARDVVASLARTRGLGGAAWLDVLGAVRAGSAGSPASVTFAGRAGDAMARALASPFAAIVPERFSPESPDGSGPFVARREDGDLVLASNPLAAEGPAFLDRVVVAPAPDLAASLRAFESGEDDVGWLGLGLHEPRRGAVPFDAGAVGWAVLRTGDQGGRWNLPGVAQGLADGIDPARLAQLGVAADRASAPDHDDDRWGGAPCDLFVRADSPWLVELARVVAAALSRTGHEVTPRPVSAQDFATARAARSFALALDLVRPLDRSPLGALLALASADDPVRALDLARHPPLGAPPPPRVAGRALRVGVVAEVRMHGGRMPDLVLPPGAAGVGVDFASITSPRPRVP